MMKYCSTICIFDSQRSDTIIIGDLYALVQDYIICNLLIYFVNASIVTVFACIIQRCTSTVIFDMEIFRILSGYIPFVTVIKIPMCLDLNNYLLEMSLHLISDTVTVSSSNLPAEQGILFFQVP